MSTSPLHLSLLRPPILHILRAAGFTSTRPSVLDTLVDLASRYLALLAAHTSRHALLRNPQQPAPPAITVTDVRLALQDVGALYPQLGVMEEQVRGEEDMRGVEAFVSWCIGPGALEIRRIAGLVPETSAAGAAAVINPSANAKGPTTTTTTMLVVERPEDFLATLKKKHAKTKDGEESRWAGTVLGREKEREREGGVRIEGWEGMEELADWAERFRRRKEVEVEVEVEGADVEMGDDGGKGGSGSTSPLSEISAVTAT